MSDFLVKTGRECGSDALLDLLRLPYGSSAPKGQGFDFSWGSVAVLEDHLTSNRNIVHKDKTVMAMGRRTPGSQERIL